MVSYCLGEMEANDVLKNMDTNRAEAAKPQEMRLGANIGYPVIR